MTRTKRNPAKANTKPAKTPTTIPQLSEEEERARNIAREFLPAFFKLQKFISDMVGFKDATGEWGKALFAVGEELERATGDCSTLSRFSHLIDVEDAVGPLGKLFDADAVARSAERKAKRAAAAKKRKAAKD